MEVRRHEGVMELRYTSSQYNTTTDDTYAQFMITSYQLKN